MLHEQTGFPIFQQEDTLEWGTAVTGVRLRLAFIGDAMTSRVRH